jgi:hypothetical protein
MPLFLLKMSTLLEGGGAQFRTEFERRQESLFGGIRKERVSSESGR